MKIKKFKISYNELKALARFYDDFRVESTNADVTNKCFLNLYTHQILIFSKKLNQRVNLHRNKEYNLPLDIVTSSFIYLTFKKVALHLDETTGDAEKAFIIRLLGECEHVIINHKINIE